MHAPRGFRYCIWAGLEGDARSPGFPILYLGAVRGWDPFRTFRSFLFNLFATVCHSRELVYRDGVHTNNIERVWGAVKDILGNIRPRNWGYGGDEMLCARANLAILLYNASLASSRSLCHRPTSCFVLPAEIPR